ncbi:MAG: AAA family ATPase [Gemmataceae bacterium]
MGGVQTEAATPSHSRVSERIVLGSIFREPGILPEVLAKVEIADFHLDAHTRILRAMLHIHGRGFPADVVAVHHHLDATRELADVGTVAYLTELWESVATAAGWEYHAAIIVEHSRRRKIQRAIAAAAALAAADAPLGVVAAEIECGLASITTSKPETALPVVYFSDLQPALDASDFVEGVLLDGAMSVIYGESGSGKTFWALDLALHVAAGIPWRGRQVDQGAVLYLALEGSHGIQNRVTAWKIAMDATAADLPFAVVPVSVDLLDPAADTPRVIAAAKAAAAKLGRAMRLVVVDTLSRALAGGDENGPADMTAFVGNIDRIRQELGTHVAVIHHSGKDAARGARGHGSLRAATDTEIEVARDADNRTAKIKKQRDLDTEGQELAFSLQSVTIGMNRRDKPVTSCVVRPAESQPDASRNLKSDERTAYKLLTDLLTEQGSLEVHIDAWRERFHHRTRPGDKPETKRKAFQRARDGLVSAGLVTCDGDHVSSGTNRGDF